FDRHGFAAHRFNQITDLNIFNANLAVRGHDRGAAQETILITTLGATTRRVLAAVFSPPLPSHGLRWRRRNRPRRSGHRRNHTEKVTSRSAVW
ncbi:MAG: hypothetical protein AAAC48_24790, partial [Phyllobacterium sp.]|uniref:hypothetical protein n=1 Tax=Phyllobacterium sp. TaxID=1871046 RepID=UPI0030F19E52